MPPLALDRGGAAPRSGSTAAALVIAVPVLWLLVFFLIPFLVVAKISLSEPAIAQPPYLPLLEWDGERALLTLNFGNFAYLWERPALRHAPTSSRSGSPSSRRCSRCSSATRWPTTSPAAPSRGARSC